LAGWTTRISIGRPLATITAVIAVFAMLLGGAVWISKKALPGDTLYALKRANENVALSTADGDTGKGRVYLSLAKTRADEIAALLSRSSAMAVGTGPSGTGGVNAHTAKLITTTLGLADSHTRNAAQLLNGQAVRSDSVDPLSIMIRWAPSQIQRLRSITDRLGAGAAHDRAAASTQLVAAALVRARALNSVLGCKGLNNAATDELGPVPGRVCNVAPKAGTRSPAPRAPGAPNPSTPTKQANTAAQPRASGATAPGPGGPVTVPSDPSSVPVSGTGGTGGTAKLSPLPVPLPSLPIQPNTGTSGALRTCTVYILGICIG